MKRLLSMLLTLVICFSLPLLVSAETALEDGVYPVASIGYGGPITLEVTVAGGVITAIEADHSETPGIGEPAIEELIEKAIAGESLDVVAGATVSSEAFISMIDEAHALAGGEVTRPESGDEEDPEDPEDSSANERVIDWNPIPEDGLLVGSYFKAEETFRQGHVGTLEVIVNEDDEISLVLFNELTRPNYYNRFYQSVPKRYSEYNYDMKAKAGAAWIESVLLVEAQMLDEQRLTGEFDMVAGASNSINQSMLPLAEKIDAAMQDYDQGAQPRAYYLVRTLEDNLVAVLMVVVDQGKITDVRYDELIPVDESLVQDEKLKSLTGQSKYDSVTYDEPSRIGFNVQMDALKEKVLETQDLLDLEGLPSTSETGDYATMGFTIRNTAWDNYLVLAKEINQAIAADYPIE